MRVRAGRPLLIVNADDFGISSGANMEIVRCFGAGRISSTTILANGSAFEEAVALASSNGFSDSIGLHVTLTHGPSLSQIPGPWLVDGQLAFAPSRLVASVAERRAAYEEVRAQIDKAVNAGISLTHLDSHHHVLNSFPLVWEAVRAAREAGIHKVRPARNTFYRRGVLKTSFKLLYNRYLRLLGTRRVKWFTDWKPYFAKWQSDGAILPEPTELMCHPAARVCGGGTEAEVLLSEAWLEFLSRFDLVSYRAV